ncbi:MAG: bifunctional diaminohydroxyphosphoribosylaminopyrimidine deaminase/5-amino-6-(5-phosphoribosylamino)uracil reductase RibD [Clostridiales bacterium]|nr:bifunctional diaminohydroxyphosphoribosylaminopyrimidine deaminase/5-amino-6-(5-phosphoribosylamino)uracil reductase RibD [Clostridiales bacterium]
MKRAIELAKKGEGKVNPNPLVGAVIVREGHIIGEGWHERFGEAHAERNALKNCTENPAGADMYVTLEPCCHTGKQPPCTLAVIESGIKRVFIGSDDPNPLVAGKGTEQLLGHGIEVIRGVMKEECDSINQVFFHYIKTKTPYVVMKYAMTADGRIFSDAYEKNITSKPAIEHMHRTRNRLMGIMVGIGTVEEDNPLLTCRMDGGRNPVRIICDSTLKIKRTSRILNSAREIPTILAAANPDREKIKEIEGMGARVMLAPGSDGRVDLKKLMKMLGNEGMDSILLEGGAALNGAALKAGTVNLVQCYIANKMFGSGLSPTMNGERIKLKKPRVLPLGDDILLEYEVM